MRELTLVLAYYENPEMLRTQLECIGALGGRVKSMLTVIVVDDGSPEHPAEAVFEHPGTRDARLYRMMVNIPWNQDACRNLGVAEAETDWVFMTDMDHLVPEQTLEWCMSSTLCPTHAYQFERVTAPTMEPYKYHPNSWLMAKSLYDSFGGYDEQLAGIYGTDGDFARALRGAGGVIKRASVPIIRVPREVIPDASTTTLARRSEWSDLMKAAMKKSPLKRGRGMFPWKRLL